MSNPSGKAPATDFCELLPDLAAGVLIRQIERQMTDIAANVVNTGNPGKVLIELQFERIGESTQVNCTSKLVGTRPGMRKKDSVVETYTHETPLFVGAGGALSVTPETIKMEFKGGSLFPNDQKA